jgi:hypothetical protein
MEYVARKFNKETYDSYDTFAKEKMIQFLINRGHLIINKNENYTHDIVSLRDGIYFYFELEVKIGYPFTCKNDYRYDTVSFLGRKKRLHNLKPFYYVILCNETNYALYCKSDEIFLNEYIQKVNVNTNVRNGNDEMYRVPLQKCVFFNIE